ncbi:MAG: hypothetical protein L0H94_03110 [Nitrospira sp.]|nr:hypothetical protein [Nitrospira sp.]
MNTWQKYPVIYEINTWVWLSELSRTYRKPVTLATVPNQEWDALAAHGFDSVWLMGVWERSPAGIATSMRNQGLLEDFRRALPDFSPEDNVGSPYCVRRDAVERVSSGIAQGNHRDRGIYCRTMRRHALRYGDAAHDAYLRTHVGTPRRAASGEGILDGGDPRSAEAWCRCPLHG